MPTSAVRATSSRVKVSPGRRPRGQRRPAARSHRGLSDRRHPGCGLVSALLTTPSPACARRPEAGVSAWPDPGRPRPGRGGRPALGGLLQPDAGARPHPRPGVRRGAGRQRAERRPAAGVRRPGRRSPGTSRQQLEPFRRRRPRGRPRSKPASPERSDRFRRCRPRRPVLPDRDACPGPRDARATDQLTVRTERAYTPVVGAFHRPARRPVFCTVRHDRQTIAVIAPIPETLWTHPVPVDHPGGVHRRHRRGALRGVCRGAQERPAWLAHLPSVTFIANSAWLALGPRPQPGRRHLAGEDLAAPRPRTLARKGFDLPGRLVRTGRRRRRRPEDRPWHRLLEPALTAILAISLRIPRPRCTEPGAGADKTRHGSTAQTTQPGSSRGRRLSWVRRRSLRGP